MDREILKRATVSEAVKRLNPGVFGPVDPVRDPRDRKSAGTLVEAVSPPQGAPNGHAARLRIRCSLVAAVPRRLDDDNLANSLKAVRDAIAEALGVDDGDRRLSWEYGQVETRGSPGVTVKLEIEPE